MHYDTNYAASYFSRRSFRDYCNNMNSDIMPLSAYSKYRNLLKQLV